MSYRVVYLSLEALTVAIYKKIFGDAFCDLVDIFGKLLNYLLEEPETALTFARTRAVSRVKELRNMLSHRDPHKDISFDELSANATALLGWLKERSDIRDLLSRDADLYTVGLCVPELCERLLELEAARDAKEIAKNRLTERLAELTEELTETRRQLKIAETLNAELVLEQNSTSVVRSPEQHVLKEGATVDGAVCNDILTQLDASASPFVPSEPLTSLIAQSVDICDSVASNLMDVDLLDKYEGAIVAKGTFSSLKETFWHNRIKGRVIIFIDGKHAGEAAIFRRWSGTVCVVQLKGMEIKMNLKRRIAILRKDIALYGTQVQ